MANFTPSKKQSTDFNGGIKYVSGDALQAETVNNIIESQLYSQEQAETAKNLVASVVQNAYAPPPVGMHHIQFSGEPTPAEIWAGTSWEIDTSMQGRVPIGSGGSYAFGATGGSADAVVVAHGNHLGEKGSGNAPGIYLAEANVSKYGTTFYGWDLTAGGEYYPARSTIGESGVGKNMMPYAVVNYWKRTA